MTPSPQKDLRRLVPRAVFFHLGSGGKSSDAFAINLIRSKSIFRLNRRLVSFAALGYFVVQGLLCLFLVLSGLSLIMEVTHLNQKLRQALPSSSSSEAFKIQLDQLSQRARASLIEIRTAIVVAKDKFQIGGKLAGIVRTIPVRTWVSSVRLNASERSVNIEAGFLVDMQEPDRLPAKGWIEALKKDPGFGPGLKKIEQVRSSYTKKGQADICLFEIRAGW